MQATFYYRVITAPCILSQCQGNSWSQFSQQCQLHGIFRSPQTSMCFVMLMLGPSRLNVCFATGFLGRERQTRRELLLFRSCLRSVASGRPPHWHLIPASLQHSHNRPCCTLRGTAPPGVPAPQNRVHSIALSLQDIRFRTSLVFQ